MRSLFLIVLCALARGEVQSGSFSIPELCDVEACSYKVTWFVNGTEAEFSVTARVEKGIWAGIGFSLDQKLEGSDVVVAWMTSSNIPVVTDRFIFSTTPFNVPVDVTNNVRVKELTQDEGLLKFTFSRDIDTGDSEDVALNQDFNIVYVWGGAGSDDEVTITKYDASGIFSGVLNFGRKEEPYPDGVKPGSATEETFSGEGSGVSQVEITQPPVTSRLPDVPESTTEGSEESEDGNELLTTTTIAEGTVMGREIPGIGSITTDEAPSPRPTSITTDGAPSPRPTSVITAETPTLGPRSLVTGGTPTPGPRKTTLVVTSKPVPSIQFVNSCSMKTCPPNSRCVVLHGIARCFCVPGFTLDKFGNCKGSAANPPVNKCAHVTCPQFSICKSGHCFCKPGYFQSPSGCTAASTTSKPMVDKCSHVKCPPFSSCKSGHCVCLPGYTQSQSGCVASTSNPMVDKCAHVKCPKFSSCKSGHCFCLPGYARSHSGCVASTTSKPMVDKCAHVKCPPFSSCKSGHCVCLPGYAQSHSGCVATSKPKPTVDKCIQMKCPPDSTCKSGLCVCDPGYVKSDEGCIASSINRDKCTGVTCPTNAECKNGFCICKNGAKYSDGKCVVITSSEGKCFGVKCPENAVCKRGHCFCKLGYSSLSGKCQKHSVSKDSCSHVKCPENARCIDGGCSCKPGYTRQANHKCAKDVKVEDKCANAKCSENQVCKGGYCFCKSGYVNVKGKCQVPTTTKDLCDGVKCQQNSYCKNGMCLCKEGYIKYSNGGCKAPQPTIQDKCALVLCPANSICKDGLCSCKKGYSKHVNGKCEAPKAPKTCAHITCPENAVCRVGKCYCKTGYLSSDTKCKKITSSTCTSLNCGTHGACVTRNGKAGCVYSSTRPHPGHPIYHGHHPPRSCRETCGSYDHVRRCHCGGLCRKFGNCCSDYQYYCGGFSNYYPFRG